MDYLKRIKEYRVLGALALLAAFIVLVANVSEVVAIPAIDIEKHTNGHDADTPTGPEIPVGDPVEWTYIVTNTGLLNLKNIVVTDDQGVVVTCPKTSLLSARNNGGVGESMICTGSGIAEAGQYGNVGKAEAFRDDGSLSVMDTDPSHYFGVEPPSGGQGCTPGFWKQEQHFDSWVGYSPSDSFDAVFGVSYGGTLLEAADANGGGVNALARHAVAALLNSTNPDVDYLYSTDEVINMVQAAFASGDYEGTKDLFEYQNELGCPLD